MMKGTQVEIFDPPACILVSFSFTICKACMGDMESCNPRDLARHLSAYKNRPMKNGNQRSETKSLWDAADQAGRLAELTSDEPEVKEAPLRRDVRTLGR